jgi:hypothetical protein
MGADDVKALKLLGATRRKPSFKFQNQAIATIYDPPHLVKCTHNLFLKYDVQFESGHLGSQNSQLPAIDKWEHIVKLLLIPCQIT